MSLTGGHLDALVAAGATVEQVVALVKADMAEREAALADKRSRDAERQRRHRASRDVTVTGSDERDTPFPLDAPPKGSPTPPPNNPPLNTPSQAHPRPCLLKGIGLPEGIPTEPWQAFVKMRKLKDKGFTEDAARGAVRKLLKMAGEGYDPGKLLWRSVDNCWKGFFESDCCRATKVAGGRDASWHKERAEFFEKIGKPDDAAEHRRKAMSIGQVANDILQSARTA